MIPLPSQAVHVIRPLGAGRIALCILLAGLLDMVLTAEGLATVHRIRVLIRLHIQRDQVVALEPAALSAGHAPPVIAVEHGTARFFPPPRVELGVVATQPINASTE